VVCFVAEGCVEYRSQIWNTIEVEAYSQSKLEDWRSYSSSNWTDCWACRLFCQIMFWSNCCHNSAFL